jgi:hypothetical protein
MAKMEMQILAVAAVVVLDLVLEVLEVKAS